MLLPYLQVNAADYAHEKRTFSSTKKIITKHQHNERALSLNLCQQHFTDFFFDFLTSSNHFLKIYTS
jgi:hypothetical protein